MTANRYCAFRRRLITLPCLIVLLAVSGMIFAQGKPPGLDFKLDPATTSIHWTLNTTLHTVHGSFKLKSGVVHIDPATGDASGEIVIDATSGESGDAGRDAKMHKDILESARYPTITFRPTHIISRGKVDLSAAGSITVAGTINLHGQNHPLQITVSLHPQKAAIAAQARFTIPFIAWGLKNPSTFILHTDKEVTLDIDATAVPAASR